MRKSVVPVLFRLVGLLLIACVLALASGTVLAQSESENIVLLLHGTGDDIFPVTSLSGLLVARIHGNPAGHHFAVTTYDQSGNLVSLLVNTTEPYMGIIPLNFDPYKMHDLNGGLIEVKAQGDWSIEIIALDSLTQAQNTQALGGYGDYVGYVKGNALTASVYGNEESRFFSVAAIGMNGGQGRGDLLVNTTSFYQGAVRLPSNKDSLVFIVKAVGAWVISLNTSDPDNLFDTNKIALKSNPYSPFTLVCGKKASKNRFVTTMGGDALG